MSTERITAKPVISEREFWRRQGGRIATGNRQQVREALKAIKERFGEVDKMPA